MTVEEPLLVATFYGSREVLCDFLCGALLRVAKMPRDQTEVVRALLAHLGGHSNRVWASQERLAALAKTSITTVRRTVRALRKIGVRVLRGDEMLGGPGPHQHPRLSENSVNCYDLSALLDLIPLELRSLSVEAIGDTQHGS